MNLYAYVGNDPVNFVDPMGLTRCSDLPPEPDGGGGMPDCIEGCRRWPSNFAAISPVTRLNDDFGNGDGGGGSGEEEGEPEEEAERERFCAELGREKIATSIRWWRIWGCGLSSDTHSRRRSARVVSGLCVRVCHSRRPLTH